MRKFFNLFMLLSFFCMTAVHAQRSWSIASESTTEIKAGMENIYVLQEGINSQWSESGFLSNKGGEKCEVEPLASTIFSFIEVEEKVEGGKSYPVYVLYNHENQKYLSNTNEHFVAEPNDAFKFTARLAKEFDPADEANWDWETYSQAVESTRCSGAEVAHAWVLCSIKEKNYIGFYSNPSFMSYCDTGHWLIKEATENELNSLEKLTLLFEQEFSNGVSKDIYPVGTAPGCISEELYNEIETLYNDAYIYIYGNKHDEATDLKYTDDINNMMKRYNSEMKAFGPGFYVWVNKRSIDAAYDNGGQVKTTLGKAAPDEWNSDNAKFIWEVINSGKKGEYYLKNFGTGNYLAKSKGLYKPYLTTADSIDAFTVKKFDGVWFLVNDGEDRGIHNDGGGTVVPWNSTDAGNLWRFDPVAQDVLDRLKGEVDQGFLNDQLNEIISSTSQINAKKTVSGYIANGSYSAPADAGLVSQLIGHNASDKHEGSVDALFDGDLENFYHTSWHNDNAPEGHHYIAVDLGKEVSDLMLKLSQRKTNNREAPTRVEFYAPEDNDTTATDWTVKLAEDTVIYGYSTPFAAGVKDSSTCISTIHFSQPARFIRMVVTKTNWNSMSGENKTSGPFWNASELRMYDAKDCVENPQYTIVPQDIKDEYEAALTAAEEEAAAGTATKATIDRLTAAVDAFWKAYIDPSDLVNSLKEAIKTADAAVEGTELGTYQKGAAEELKTAVAAIQKVVDDKNAAKEAFTADEIKACQDQLKAALKAFDGKLNAIANGVYRIVCASTANERQNSACIASDNADYMNGTPIWRYKFEGDDVDINARFNTLWYVENTEDGFTFKNLANGLYMGNAYEGLTEEELENTEILPRVGYSKEPKHFRLEAFDNVEEGTTGVFLMCLTKGEYVNLDPIGTVVHYFDRNDAHAAFKFEPVIAEDFSSFYLADAEPGKVQICTFPFEINSAYCEGPDGTQGGAYKVIGQKDGSIQLNLYDSENGETIPAGTPFIINTRPADPTAEGDKGENSISIDLAVETLDGILKMDHVITPVEQNGLVSAPLAVTPGAGYGILSEGKVIISDGKQQVPAATGLFNNAIPETAEEGAFHLVIDGTISGEGTNVGIKDAVIVKNELTDVYTIEGIMIRKNVRTSEATKGLPKGIYILSGKKIVVK